VQLLRSLGRRDRALDVRDNAKHRQAGRLLDFLGAAQALVEEIARDRHQPKTISPLDAIETEAATDSPSGHCRGRRESS
jgi:hypothetical protein